MYSMLTPVDDRLLTMGWVLTSRGRNANGWYMSPVSRHGIAGIWVAFFSDSSDIVADRGRPTASPSRER